MVSLLHSTARLTTDGDGNISARIIGGGGSHDSSDAGADFMLIAPCGLVFAREDGCSNVWYMEVTVAAASKAFFGYRELEHPHRVFALSSSSDAALHHDDVLLSLATVPNGTPCWQRGDVIACAADFNRGKLSFFCFKEDGRRFETFLELNAAASFVPVFGFDPGFSFNVNFGERPFRALQLFHRMRCHSVHRRLRQLSEQQFARNSSERLHYGSMVACEAGVLVERVSKGK